jgi:hypothetical protein
MKKLALLFLLASMCACVHSQVKVTGSASVSGTAAINANSNLTVSSLVITPANQTVDVGQAIGYTATVTFSDGYNAERYQLRELVIVERRSCGESGPYLS